MRRVYTRRRTEFYANMNFNDLLVELYCILTFSVCVVDSETMMSSALTLPWVSIASLGDVVPTPNDAFEIAIIPFVSKPPLIISL